MNAAVLGRIVFGAAAVLFGAIALAWHDAATWQSLSKIWALPLGTVVGTCLMVAQIWGGIALTYPRSARWASVVLAVVYGIFSVICIPAIVASPRAFDAYDGFFEQFSLFAGALAVYAVTETNAARSKALARAARIGMGICAVSFALAQKIYLNQTAGLVPTWIPPNQLFWALLTTAAFALAAVALLINVRAQLAARLMSAMIVLFGAIVWIPILAAHPRAHFSWSEFALTMLIAGAAWAVADAISRTERSAA